MILVFNTMLRLWYLILCRDYLYFKNLNIAPAAISIFFFLRIFNFSLRKIASDSPSKKILPGWSLARGAKIALGHYQIVIIWPPNPPPSPVSQLFTPGLINTPRG